MPKWITIRFARELCFVTGVGLVIAGLTFFDPRLALIALGVTLAAGSGYAITTRRA